MHPIVNCRIFQRTSFIITTFLISACVRYWKMFLEKKKCFIDGELADKRCKVDNESLQQSLDVVPHHLASALRVRNKIRETIIELTAKESLAKDRKLLDLSLGDPTKYGGIFKQSIWIKKKTHLTLFKQQTKEPFLPPKILVDNLVSVITSNNHHGYTIAVGTNASREAVARYHNIKNFQNVFLTSGCSAALDMTFRSIIEKQSDVILLPTPGFPLYETLCTCHGIEYVRYPLDVNRDWEIDVSALLHLKVRDIIATTKKK